MRFVHLPHWISSQEKILRPNSCTQKGKGQIKNLQSTPSAQTNYPDLCGMITANEKMLTAVVGALWGGSREVESVHNASADSLPQHGLHPHRQRLVHFPIEPAAR
jgi:hypothetical protein